MSMPDTKIINCKAVEEDVKIRMFALNIPSNKQYIKQIQCNKHENNNCTLRYSEGCILNKYIQQGYKYVSE